MSEIAETPIVFAHTGDGEYPYRALVDDTVVIIRVNDFPAEPLYSVYLDGTPVEDLEDWPATWTRPPLPDHLRRLVEP